MNPSPEVKELGLLAALCCAAGAVVSFTLAYAFSGCAFLTVGFMACLFPLARLGTRRRAYYFGLGIGLAVYTPHLYFFKETFSWGAVALWYILPFWLGIFLMLGRSCLLRFGPVAWACLAPFLWTGLEFTRSELYYLRFSWLNSGYAFSDSSALHYVAAYGVYGIGFLFMAAVGVAHLRERARWAGIGLLTAAAVYPALLEAPRLSPQKTLRVAGVQLEFRGAPSVITALNETIAKYPDASLLVLSEYTFTEPIPKGIKNWCRDHRKFLVVGGEDTTPGSNFYNTAFVVDTNGEIVFQQAKCVPIQFMKDGLPAPQQKLWDSPWGRIGLAICYDASYSRVTDELVRQGAQALVIPTMDITNWGEAQHLLHARVAPMRAAEYEVPIFRLCSSGISEFVDASGRVVSSAPFPGDGAMLAAEIPLPEHGRMPPDRLLARISAGVVAALCGWLAIEGLWRRNPAGRGLPAQPSRSASN
jgi:apolipoprotein N-acyltransferase